MPIAILSEHNDLADSVRNLVKRVAPSDVLHEALETPISNPPPYWKAAAEQGLQGLHLSEDVGGQGFGILELAIVLAEFGYGAVPGPFVPSAIASALIAANDPGDKLLEGLASGETIAAYAIDSGLTATRPGWRPRHPRRGPRGTRRRAGVAPGAARVDRQPRGVDRPRRRPGRDRTRQERRPAAALGPRARQRRRGGRRPRADQPQPHPRPRPDVDAAVRRVHRRRALGHRHRVGVRQDP